MRVLLTGLIALMIFVSASTPVSNEVTGKWKTIDDETGKPKSIVLLYKQNGKLYGKILKLFRGPDEEQNPLCDECEGALHNKPIIGMQIVNGLEYDDGEWEGDDGILDPANGKVYDCKLWLDEDNPDVLNVRGYIGFLYRTQYWHRVKE
jgi:uncharacterized protein (DUF2147 family)